MKNTMPKEKKKKEIREDLFLRKKFPDHDIIIIDGRHSCARHLMLYIATLPFVKEFFIEDEAAIPAKAATTQTKNTETDQQL
jgi:hypothetical protein